MCVLEQRAQAERTIVQQLAELRIDESGSATTASVNRNPYLPSSMAMAADNRGLAQEGLTLRTDYRYVPHGLKPTRESLGAVRAHTEKLRRELGLRRA
eukprot:COSAG05_NODE_16281_length_349_cov_1.008000_1_plen_97_part_10